MQLCVQQKWAGFDPCSRSHSKNVYECANINIQPERFSVLDVLKQFLTESETGPRWLHCRRHAGVSPANYVITMTCISFGELGLENRI